MKNFLVYTLATITGIIMASILIFFIMLASLSAMVAVGEKPVSISDNSILVLKADVSVPDRGNPNPFASFDIINMTFSQAPGLNDILNNLEKAASDDKIKGVLIEGGIMPSGWATTEEIRNALGNFREKSGKFVIAYSDYLCEQEGYYLSSIADKFYINPASMVDFKGLSGEVMFYKKALEKIGVDVQVVRHGKFKGAVEPYLMNELSAENRAQIEDYVGSIWKHVVGKMSESRGIPEDQLNRLADKLAGNLASSALENKLVDGLLYRDELVDTLKSLSGLTSGDEINMVSMSRYTKVSNPNKLVSSKNRISVVYASGTIVNGKGSDYNIGGNKYADIIKKERLDSTVKAIVLRVNSPGGVASSADLIWREISLAANVKPVVISMGNYAASGGYYISAPGTRIFADPTTISGSIGVFGLIPNAGKLLKDKLGINTETVKTNENSDFPSIYRPMNVYEKEAMQAIVESTYSDFVNKVATGRKMTFSAVDSIGQGRVWAGTSALSKGLVDEIGGLKDAIKSAAGLAGVETYSIRELPALEEPYQRLMSQLTGEVRMIALRKELGDYLEIYRELSEIKNISGIQVRLPYFIEIH